MRHPLHRIPDGRRLPVFLASAAATGALGLYMAVALKPGRRGIVALELARNEREAREVISSWDAEGRRRALLNIHLDYLFIPAYSTAMVLACRWAGRESATGAALAWGQAIAALLDAVENVALLKMVRGDVEEPWPQLSRWSPSPSSPSSSSARATRQPARSSGSRRGKSLSSRAFRLCPDGQGVLAVRGDRTVAIILSKAFLLAEDKEIKDPTILHQIRR